MELFNPHKQEFQITITADASRGIWASSIYNGRGKAIRYGGQLPTSASSHTLLLLSLANTLRSVSRQNYANTQERAGRGTAKPRVQVLVVGDATFAPALAGLLGKQGDSKLRTGRNFLTIAAQQVARFSLDLQTSNDVRDLALLAWAQKGLYPTKEFETLPPALVPTIVSQIVRAAV